MNQFFISTEIPYINASAHIGHAQEFLLAETLKRILTSQGHKVFLQSGTDDNSLKNILAAQQLGLDPKDYIKQQGEKFKSLLSSLNVTPDFFIQTSHERHHRGVRKFIEGLDQSDLYEGSYHGLYCVGCEDFVRKEDLVDGICVDHKKPPQETQEKNIFFRLSKYQDQIYDLIDSDQVKIYPKSRKNEILNFIKRGLQDISISRPTNDVSPCLKTGVSLRDV